MPTGNALLLVPLLWVVVTVCWAPMLLSKPLRRLFSVWPTGRLAVNYPLLIGLIVLGHLAVFFPFGVTADPGSLDLLRYAGLTTIATPAVVLAAVLALPRVTDIKLPDGVTIPLAVGAVWYALVVGVVFALLAFLIFVFFFPG